MATESDRILVDRPALHRKVWAAPLPAAAEKLKVSAPTLRRMCEILDVPLPGRGSWANNVVPHRKKLPPREDGGTESVWLVRGRKHFVLEADPQAAKHQEPADVPAGLHPIVLRAARHYARPLIGIDGTMKPRTSAAPSMRVSVEQRERALLFLDRLVKRLEKEGSAVSWDGPILIEIPDHGAIQVTIREEVAKVERPPSPAEAERDKDRLFPVGKRPYLAERPTGTLIIAVRDPLSVVNVPCCWKDEGRRTLERRVKEVASGLLAYARVRRGIEETEEARQIALTRERDRQVEEKRAEILEQQRRERLDAEIDAWEKAAKIRKYADELEAAHLRGREGRVPAEVVGWLEWMRGHADEVDPTVVA
jgi:hypothetical protein